MELYITGTGQQINVHEVTKCKGEVCVIHNPSGHHMVNWPTHWRDDRHLMERLCPCGIGHPDPDDLAYSKNTNKSIHGCCGHCHEPRDERESNP